MPLEYKVVERVLSDGSREELIGFGSLRVGDVIYFTDMDAGPFVVTTPPVWLEAEMNYIMDVELVLTERIQ